MTVTRAYPFGEPDAVEVAPEYADLREREPVCRVALPYGGEGWLVTRYDDVRTVLSDRRFSRAALVGRDVPRTIPRIPQAKNLMTTDPPEHTALRRLVSKAFTPRRIEQLRPRAEQVTAELLDAVVRAGPPADLVEALAKPLPTRLICDLLGVPFEDRSRFFGWADAVLDTSMDGTQQVQLRDYLGDLVARRRVEPTDDLLGVLVAAQEEDGSRLSDHQLVGFGITLLLAGLETTANQIGNFVYVLLTHPDELARLRADPALLPTAIEEMLRFTPLTAAAGFTRVAVEDVELSGVLVRAGEAVLVHLDAADRDGREFDEPDRLDLSRAHNPHLAFGHGAHFCLGAQLARVELVTAIGQLLARLPGLRLAKPAPELRWKRDRAVRGLLELPVAWN